MVWCRITTTVRTMTWLDVVRVGRRGRRARLDRVVVVALWTSGRGLRRFRRWSRRELNPSAGSFRVRVSIRSAPVRPLGDGHEHWAESGPGGSDGVVLVVEKCGEACFVELLDVFVPGGAGRLDRYFDVDAAGAVAVSAG